jgi:hypothetical protein
VPDVACVPLQPFDAVHEVAPLDVQVIVVVPPLVTEVGLALIVTVGAAVMPTVTAFVVVPPVPVQASV